MCNETVLRKIKKALELADRAGTEAEAQTALAMAQELMVKYSVSEKDLPSDQAEIVTIYYKEDSQKIDRFTKRFMVTLRNHFPVEIIISHSMGLNRMGIIGRRADAENFRAMVGVTIHQFNKMYYRHHRAMKKANPNISRQEIKDFKDSYSNGFLKGLDNALKINEKEKGLIVVSPQAVLDELKTQANGRTSHISMGNKGAGYREGLNDGAETGKEAKRNKKRIEA